MACSLHSKGKGLVFDFEKLSTVKCDEFPCVLVFLAQGQRGIVQNGKMKKVSENFIGERVAVHHRGDNRFNEVLMGYR